MRQNGDGSNSSGGGNSNSGSSSRRDTSGAAGMFIFCLFYYTTFFFYVHLTCEDNDATTKEMEEMEGLTPGPEMCCVPCKFFLYVFLSTK